MVDVSRKEPTQRTATASGRIYIPRVAYELITEAPGEVEPTVPSSQPPSSSLSSPASALERAKRKARAKGDVLTVAQLAAIMGCKRTADLIPLCHPLQLSHISVSLHPELVDARAHPNARTTTEPLPPRDVDADNRVSLDYPRVRGEHESGFGRGGCVESQFESQSGSAHFYQHAPAETQTRVQQPPTPPAETQQLQQQPPPPHLCQHPYQHPSADIQGATEYPPSDDDDDNAQAPSRPRRSVYSVRCVASVTCEGKTGVEMEALTAVSVGLLTVWDMLKAVAGREMVMGDIAVVEKRGGKSGDFSRDVVM